MGWFKRKFRNTHQLPGWIITFAAGLLKVLRFLFIRVRIVDPDGLIQKARGMVVVTWHNRLLFFPAIFPAEVRKRTAAVVSASRDGQYVADLIERFGIRSARGSSNKAGAHAQLEAARALQAGNHVVFTPDGPRGPRYRMSRGPVHLASLFHTSVVPVAINASRYWEFRSWDRFQVPKPFSTLTLVIGTPIPIPPDLDADGIERYRKICEDALNEASLVREEDKPTEAELEEARRKKEAKKLAAQAKKEKA